MALIDVAKPMGKTARDRILARAALLPVVKSSATSSRARPAPKTPEPTEQTDKRKETQVRRENSTVWNTAKSMSASSVISRQLPSAVKPTEQVLEQSEVKKEESWLDAVRRISEDATEAERPASWDEAVEAVNATVKRGENVIKSAGTHIGAGYANLMGFLVENTPTQYVEDYMIDPVAVARGDLERIKQTREDFEQEKLEATMKLYENADALASMSAEYAEDAKEGLDGLGRFLIDVGSSTLQMGGDALIAILSGGGTLAPMFLRTLGSGTQKARQAGATGIQQLGYGFLTAVTEVGTEKLTSIIGIFNKAFGGGMADDFIGPLIDKLGGSVAGKTALKSCASMLSEGLEEALSSVLNPVIEYATYNKDALSQYSDSEFWLDALYDGVIGAVASSGFAAGDVRGNYNQYSAQDAQNSPSNTGIKQLQADTSTRSQLTEGKPTDFGGDKIAAVQNLETLDRMMQSSEKTEPQAAQSKTSGLTHESESNIMERESTEDIKAQYMAAINEEVAKRQDSELIRLARESYAMAMLDDGYKRPEILERTGVTLDESGKAVTAEGANTQTREAPADVTSESRASAQAIDEAKIDQLIREGYDAPWRRDDSIANAKSDTDVTLDKAGKPADVTPDNRNTALPSDEATLDRLSREGIAKAMFSDDVATADIQRATDVTLDDSGEVVRNEAPLATQMLETPADAAPDHRNTAQAIEPVQSLEAGLEAATNEAIAQTKNIDEDNDMVDSHDEAETVVADEQQNDTAVVVGSGWDMSRGGAEINGIQYSEHALERMAPNTQEVRGELYARAQQRAVAANLSPGTVEYQIFINKQINPRGIPPLVIEDAIKNIPAIRGKYPDTFIHQSADVTVIVNGDGKVITVIPRRGV